MITYMWDLNHDTNELIQETEMDLQTQKANFPLYLRGKGVSVLDQQILTTIYKTDKQQGPTAYSTEIQIQDPIINQNGKEKNMCTYN